MRLTPYISINNLNYIFPDSDHQIFNGINFTCGQQKVGLVGRNGAGKSTLLSLIASGHPCVSTSGSLAYVRQEPNIDTKQSIADFLEVSEKLAALRRIEQGQLHEQDFELVNDDWECGKRIQQQLDDFGISQVSLLQKISTLSGGEQTRIALLKSFSSSADIVLLDEPTNNLDRQARCALYDRVSRFEGCLIIVSHDRHLLRLVNNIAEINSNGLEIYGGNYDHYREEKRIRDNALQHELHSKLQKLKKSKENIQIRKQQHQKGVSKGKQTKKAMIKAKGRADKLALNAAKGRSEKTQRRITMQADRKLKNVNEEISQARKQIEITDEFVINMKKTSLANNKIVLEINDLCFAYDTNRKIINHFNLLMKGAERVAITGKNGCGKSTLLKLILSELTPTTGSIALGVNRINYFDQHAKLLCHDKTVIDNFTTLNPDISDAQAWSILAQFKFRKDNVFKKVSALSGGEKLRALFACVLMSNEPPQLLLIDEPSNHLDLESIQVIEKALNNYQGAMLVISHDDEFLRNIKCEQTISFQNDRN